MLVPGRYAAIDIGTVTCRMLVADVDETGVHELAREYAITNLGEGVDATGALAPSAMQRVLSAIDSFLLVRNGLSASDNPVRATVAVATSAARDARNSADFVELLKSRGVDLSVIPGEREAALSFSGASLDFPGENLLVVDVGGGSTEIVFGVGGASPSCGRSFNVGCRRVTEKFLASDPPSAGEIERARRWVDDAFSRWFVEQGERVAAIDRVVAVAGTATTVVSIREEMERYDSKRVHGACVSRADLARIYDRLKALPLREREQVVGLDPKRAPVMVAGLLILRSVLDAAHADAFTVSETDILHGIVLAAARAGFAQHGL